MCISVSVCAWVSDRERVCVCLCVWMCVYECELSLWVECVSQFVCACESVCEWVFLFSALNVSKSFPSLIPHNSVIYVFAVVLCVQCVGILSLIETTWHCHECVCICCSQTTPRNGSSAVYLTGGINLVPLLHTTAQYGGSTSANTKNIAIMARLWSENVPLKAVYLLTHTPRTHTLTFEYEMRSKGIIHSMENVSHHRKLHCARLVAIRAQWVIGSADPPMRYTTPLTLPWNSEVNCSMTWG